MGSDSSSLNERRRLDDEAELQQWFAALDRQSPPVRPEFLAALRDTCRQELALRRTASGVPFWRGLFAPGQRAGTPHGGFGWRPALVATCVALVVLFAAAFGADMLQNSNSARVAMLTVRAGEVDVARPVRFFVDTGLTREISAQPDTSLRLRPGDEIASNQAADAEIALPDGSQIALGPGTELTIEELQARTASRPLVVAMRLDRGEVRSQVERLSPEGGERFEVSTPNLVAQVRGTVFRVDVRTEGTRVATDRGLVSVSWNGQTIDVKAGQELSVLLRASAAEVYIRPQSPVLTNDLPSDTVVVEENGQPTFFTAQSGVGLRIQSQPNVTVEVFANEELIGAVRTDDAGQAALAFVPPDEGTFGITAVMANAAGEKSLPSVPQWFVIDRTRPGLWLDEPEEPQVSTQDVVVAGRTEPGVRLTLNGQPVVVDAEGQFRLSITLTPGANDLNWVAVDPAGNAIHLQSVVEYEQVTG